MKPLQYIVISLFLLVNLLVGSVSYGQMTRRLIRSSAEVPMHVKWHPTFPVYSFVGNHIPAEDFWDNWRPHFVMHMGVFWRTISAHDSVCIYINDSNFKTVAYEPQGRNGNKIIIKDTLATIYALEETIDYLKNRLLGMNEEIEHFSEVILLLNKDGSIIDKTALVAALKITDYYFKTDK